MIRHPNTTINEYFPAGPIITQVSSNSVCNLFTFHKFDPSLPWSEYDIEVKNEWSFSNSSYPSYSNKSNFTISISKDQRWGAVSSSDIIADNNQEDENNESMEENPSI